eukprot:7724921-Pyramimonas_sp.AAC.1
MLRNRRHRMPPSGRRRAREEGRGGPAQIGGAQAWISDPWTWRAVAKSMDRGRCPPPSAAGAASFGGGTPRFPMEAGPV